MSVLEYCRQDVRVTCAGANKHRMIFHEASLGVDCFGGKYSTLASACYASLVADFYDPDKDPMCSLSGDLGVKIRRAGGGTRMRSARRWNSRRKCSCSV